MKMSAVSDFSAAFFYALTGILGHTNASFTLDTYAHVTDDMKIE